MSPHLSELVFSTPQPQKPDDSPTGPGSLVWNRRPCTPWAVALNASSPNRTAGMTTPQEAEASTGGQLSYRPPCSNDLACPDKPRRTQGRKPALSNGRRRNTLCSRLETGQHNSTASYTPGTSHTGIQCHAGVPVETAPSRFRGTIPAWDQRRRNQLAAVFGQDLHDVVDCAGSERISADGVAYCLLPQPVGSVPALPDLRCVADRGTDQPCVCLDPPHAAVLRLKWRMRDARRGVFLGSEGRRHPRCFFGGCIRSRFKKRDHS